MLYVKGSHHVLGDWWGSPEHLAFRAWLEQRADAYHTVVWDGDPVDSKNFTHVLISDVPELLPSARLVAVRIASQVDRPGFQQDLKRTGAATAVVPDSVIDDPAVAATSRPPHLRDAQWRYVRLGAEGMALHGPGDVVVLRDGDVPLHELRYSADHARHLHEWFCFRVDGRSSICDAYEDELRREEHQDARGSTTPLGEQFHVSPLVLPSLDAVDGPGGQGAARRPRPMGYSFKMRARPER